MTRLYPQKLGRISWLAIDFLANQPPNPLLIQLLSHDSVNRQLAALRVHFRWATEVELIASNPAAAIKMVEQTEPGPRWLRREET